MFASKHVSWLAALLLLVIVRFSDAAPLEGRGVDTRVIPNMPGGLRSIAPGTYPRANRLADNSIILSYTAFKDGNSIITVARSTDEGVTWTTLGTVISGSMATRDIDNPYVLQLPTGRILVAYRNHIRKDSTTYSLYRITISYSDDSGATWKWLCDPASDQNSVNGNWEPFLRLSMNKTLQLYYSRENNASDQDNLMRESTDGGATWSLSKIISGAESNNQRDGMVGVVTIDGPNLIAVFESEAGGYFTINSVTSPDDGKTWGNRQRVYTPTGSDYNAGSPQVINVNGTLVASFGSDEGSGSHTWSSTPTNAEAKLVTSGDGGATWGNKFTFGSAPSYWSGLMTLGDNCFLAMTEHNTASVGTITLS